MTGTDAITLAHNAARMIGGVSLTIEEIGAVTGVFVSGGLPVPGAGMDEGMSDEHRTYAFSVLDADITPAAIVGGMLVTFNDRFADEEFEIVAGTVERTDIDWRFEVQERETHKRYDF